MKRRRRMRRNGWSSEDKMLAVVGVVTVVGVVAIMKQRKDTAAAATVAGLRGLRGLGAYFQDPVNIPFSGLGANYVAVR